MSVKVLVPARMYPSGNSYWHNFYKHTVNSNGYGTLPGLTLMQLRNELKKDNVSIKLTKNQVNYLLQFPSQQALTMFMLRWS